MNNCVKCNTPMAVENPCHVCGGIRHYRMATDEENEAITKALSEMIPKDLKIAVSFDTTGNVIIDNRTDTKESVMDILKGE